MSGRVVGASVGATAGRAAARLVQGAVVKTTSHPRPNPSIMYFPGLSSSPFHDARKFEWVEALEANVDAIRAEYLALQESGLQSDYEVGVGEHTLHSGTWEWFSFVTKGEANGGIASQCPVTAESLFSIPSLMTGGIPFAYAFYSKLPGGSSIRAHFGPANFRLRCHFPLIVPSGCGIRVANEERAWEEGKCMIFDDSYDHEVWHNGTEERVVLLFDTWHPDLTLEEREEITGMFDEARRQGWISTGGGGSKHSSSGGAPGLTR